MRRSPWQPRDSVPEDAPPFPVQRFSLVPVLWCSQVLHQRWNSLRFGLALAFSAVVAPRGRDGGLWVRCCGSALLLLSLLSAAMASALGGVRRACSSRLAGGPESWLRVCRLLHQAGPEMMRAWMRLLGWERELSLSRGDASQPHSVLLQPAQAAPVGTGSCRKAAMQGRCEKGSSASLCRSCRRVKNCFHLLVGE